MSSEIAIKVSNLSKCCQIYEKTNDRLKQFIVPKLCQAIPALKRFFPGPSLCSPHFLINHEHNQTF